MIAQNYREVEYVGLPNVQIDARYNWWGISGTSVSAANALTNPTLSSRPTICNILNTPSLTVPAGDNAALIAAIAYASTLDEATVELAQGSIYNLTELFYQSEYAFSGSALPAIRNHVTINGNGATINWTGSEYARLFTIFDAHLTLNNVILSNGNTRQGAAIYVYRGTVELNEVTLRNNQAMVDTYPAGGGIYAWHSDVTVNNSSFESNISDIGGAIYSFETTLSVANSVFFANDAQEIGGSAIAIARGNDVTITGNCFVGNGSIAVYTDFSNNGSTVINAANNWWGATDGPSGAGTGSGDAVGERVIYTPFITSMPEGCPQSPLAAIDENFNSADFIESIEFTLRANGGVPPYTFSNISTPEHGTLTGTPPTLLYTLEPGFIGITSFTFTVSDTDGNSDTGIVTFNIRTSNIQVNSTAQEVPFVNNGNCTLGEAIHAANTDTAVDACAAGNGEDIIKLTPETYTLNQVDNLTTGANGFPVITSPIAIDGSGATITRSSESDVPDFRFFYVAEDGVLELINLSLSNGRLWAVNFETDRGGAIHAVGDLALGNVTISNNSAYYEAGGVYSVGSDKVLYVIGSSILDNVTNGLGGGFATCGEAEILESIIENNTAYLGGGVYNFCNTLTITETTIQNNSATLSGGGIENRGGGATIEVTDSILRNNSAPTGSSINANYTGSGFSYLNIHNSCILDRSTSAANRSHQWSFVDWTSNWWGSISGPGGSGPGTGSRITGFNMTSQPENYTPFHIMPILGCETLPPLAISRNYYGAFETPLNLTLEVADGVPPYSFEVLTQPDSGTISGTAPNLIYTPDAGFNGETSFTFRVTDDNGDNSEGTATLIIAPDLIAEAQTIATTFDTVVDFSLIVSGGRIPYTFTITTAPTHGDLSGAASAQTYTPDPGFTGTDSFAYEVIDANGDTDSTTVTITVGLPLDAVDQSLTTLEGTSLPVRLRAQNGTTPYMFQVSSPAHGTVLGSGENRTYVPQSGFTGADSFNFTVTDQSGQTDIGTIIIQVSAGLANGNFGSGLANWTFSPDLSRNVTGGVLFTYRMNTSNTGNFYQDLGFDPPETAPLQLNVQLGNTSPLPKSVTVIAHTPGNLDGSIQCTFTIPAFAPLTPYQMRGVTGTDWAAVRVEFRINSADNLPTLRVDNIVLQYQPEANISQTECTTILPTNQQLLINGGFTNGEGNWGFTTDLAHSVTNGILNVYRINTSSVGSFYQDIGYLLPWGAPVELTMQLGNSSPLIKTVNVVAHSPWNFNGYFQCSFTVPAFSPMQTYTMRGIAGAQWTGIRLEVYLPSADNLAALRVDNFNLQYVPTGSFSGTECLPPALPQNSNLLVNGGFTNGEGNWGFTTDLAHSVTNGILNVYRINTGSVGSFYQDIGFTVPSGTPLELSLQLGNTSSSPKTVNVVAHSPWNFNGYFQCSFTVPAFSPMQTYTMRGIAGAQWTGIRLEVYVNPANNSPALLVDNFNLQRESFAVTSTECTVASP
jgi:hypothetical protein